MIEVARGAYRRPLFWITAALALIALWLGVGVAYFSGELNRLFSEERLNQAYSNNLNHLLLGLTTAETGQRGYLITQNPDYLAPYQTALPQIQQDLKTLNDSPLSAEHKSKLQQINVIVKNKLDELKSTIAALQINGQSAAFAIVDSNVGDQEMVTLRQLISTTSDHQNDDVRAKISSAESRTKALEYVAPATAIVDFGLIVLILFLTRRTARKEQELEGLKEQFVALASHQLRTPATAVKQYLNLLLSGGFGDLKPEQTKIIKIINENNERGIKVANSLLDVTKADSQNINISDVPVNLTLPLEHILKHYRKAFKEARDQAIVLKMPKKAVTAKVDPFYIRLIFENLLENASKYSDPGKKINVQLKNQHGRITFSVEDHGQGIKRQDINLLFKKFSRLDSGAKKADGSGLGLYLVHQAAKLHGGDVTVESTPGKGSTFTAYFERGM